MGLIAYPLHSMQNAGMSTSITIRDVPDQIRDELAARAAATGRSLQEYLRRRLVELAEQPDAEALPAQIRARKAAHSSSLTPEDIIGMRDTDRR